MSYAHAINLINETEPDMPPLFITLMANADGMKTHPTFLETFGLENICVKQDGTLVEMVED